MFRSQSTKEKIACKCATKYCDPYNAVIEQQLTQTRWQQISSITTINVDNFEVQAFRTQFNSSVYRCVLQFHRRFNATSNMESLSENTMFPIGFVIELILLLSYILVQVIKVYFLLQRDRLNSVIG